MLSFGWVRGGYLELDLQFERVEVFVDAVVVRAVPEHVARRHHVDAEVVARAGALGERELPRRRRS